MAMYELRSAYENLTRMNFIGAGQYDIPTLGIHLEKMPKHEEMRLRNLMQKKGVKIGYNGGLGYTLHYIK